MKPKHLILGLLPVLSLGFASWVSATTRTLTAHLTADGYPNNSQLFYCLGTTPNPHVQAEARGLDRCGNPTSGGSQWPTPRALATGTGTSQSVQFDDLGASGPCGATVQHKAVVQVHTILNGEDFYFDYGSGALYSQCWNSTSNPRKCIGSIPKFQLPVRTATGNCVWTSLQAFSYGSTP